MTSEGLGEMFEGDSADTCAGKYPLTSMGSERRVSHAQTRGEDPIGVSGIYILFSSSLPILCSNIFNFLLEQDFCIKMLFNGHRFRVQHIEYKTVQPEIIRLYIYKSYCQKHFVLMLSHFQ